MPVEEASGKVRDDDRYEDDKNRNHVQRRYHRRWNEPGQSCHGEGIAAWLDGPSVPGAPQRGHRCHVSDAPAARNKSAEGALHISVHAPKCATTTGSKDGDKGGDADTDDGSISSGGR